MSEFDFDLFVSHASEDKESFVRPFVAALQDAHLEVWFDEATLQVGDRLIQSIERGLARSRFGIVVLSPAFFEKNWPRVELDALTNRELATGEKVLLPVWLDVSADDVGLYSPLLADRYAIIGSRGVEYTASRVAEVVRPAGSPLVLARGLLADEGVATPPPTDDFWIDAIESAAEIDGEGGFQSAMLWERWGFPLPPKDGTVQGRARRLAQSVMRNAWVAEAERRPITQITEPHVVREFIEEMPGLLETCFQHPSYLGAYAPQLLIPGFGGPFEELFDDWLTYAQDKGRVGETIALHKSSYKGERADLLAEAFAIGELHGPSVAYYERSDYLFWLLSSKSEWLPEHVREMLATGLCQSRSWLISSRVEMHPGSEEIIAEIDAVVSQNKWERKVRTPMIERAVAALAAVSAKDLDLPESAETLARRLLDRDGLRSLITHRSRLHWEM
jgi:hypothetical protein